MQSREGPIMVEKIFLILLIIPVLYLFILLIGKTINTIAESNNAEKAQPISEGDLTPKKIQRQKSKVKEKKAESPKSKRRRRKKIEEKGPVQAESVNFYEQKSSKSIYAERNNKDNNRGTPSKK